MLELLTFLLLPASNLERQNRLSQRAARILKSSFIIP